MLIKLRIYVAFLRGDIKHHYFFNENDYFLLYRRECFTVKNTTRKIHAKLHLGLEWRIFHYKCWDLHSANSPNKKSLSLMRSNLIGHTIFRTSRKYRMTRSLIFDKWENSYRFFPPFGALRKVIESKCLQRSLLSQNHGLKVCRQERKLNRISDAEERVKTYRRNSLEGAEFIITVRKKDSNEDYEPSSLRSLMASFERYLKKKNYGFSIMKDAEFEQARKALQSKQEDLTERKRQ